METVSNPRAMRLKRLIPEPVGIFYQAIGRVVVPICFAAKAVAKQPRPERNNSICGSLLAMRRVQSAIVIVALLAIPLALVARTGPCAQSQCSRMCDLILRSVRVQHMHCTCGMTADGSQCQKNSSQKLPDYGLNAPMAPTMPSARVALVAPSFTRRAVARELESPAFGFRSEPIQPPRA
jgi:hypothetical protein